MKKDFEDLQNNLIALQKISFNFTGLSANQINKLVGTLPINELQSRTNKIQSIQSASYGNFDASNLQKYAEAIKELGASQAALLLSTQGLTTAQIAETLSVNESNTAKIYQAMLDAGLLKSKVSLTTAKMQETLQTVLGTEADAAATMASLGLSAAIEGEEIQTVQLTTKKIEEAMATGALTTAQAQEFAMRTGVIAQTSVQNTIMPKWIATLKAATLAIWDQVKAMTVWLATNPAGWATLAVGAIAALAAGIYAYNKSIDQAVDNAREKLAETEEALSSLVSEKEKTVQLIKELEDLEKSNKMSLTDKADLESLRAQNKELRIRLLYLNKQKELENEDLVNAAKKKYDRDYGKQTVSRDTIDQYKSKLAYTPDSQPLTEDPSISQATLEYNIQEKQRIEESDDLDALIAKYEYYYDARQKAMQSNDETALTLYQEKLKAVEKSLIDSRIEVQGFADDLSATGKASSELNDANDKLALIDITLFAKEKAAFHFINDNFLQSEKKKLVELSETTKLTGEELSINYSDVAAYLEKNSLDLSDLTSILKAYKDELISTTPLNLTNDQVIEKTKNHLRGLFISTPVTLNQTDLTQATEQYEDWISKFSNDDIVLLYTIMNDSDTSGWSFEDFDKELDKRKDISFSATVDNLDGLTDAFSILNNLYKELVDENKNISFEDISTLNDKFKDVSDLKSYIDAIAEAKGETEATEEAFSNLANAYIRQSGVLDQVTDANADLIESYLTEQGVTNANQLVQEALGQKKAEAAWASRDLSNATAEEILALAQEAGVTGDAESAFASYIVQKMLADTAMDPTADLTALANIIESLGIATKAWSRYLAIKNRMAEIEADPNYLGKDEYGNVIPKKVVMGEYQVLLDDTEKELQKDADAIFKKSSNDGGKKKTSAASSSTPKQASETKKEYDWLTRATTAINRNRSKTKELVDDETQSYHDQISTLQKLISLDDHLVDITSTAQATYTNRWDEISAKMLQVFGEIDGNNLISKIKSGDTSLEGSKNSFSSEQAELLDHAIKTYEDMTKAEDDYTNAVKERTQHIREEYAKRVAEVESYVDEVSSALSQAEAKLELKDITGWEVTESDYQRLISLSRDQENLYYNQIDALKDQLSSVEEFGPEYYSIQSSIASCESAIIDCQIQQEEWNEKILRLPIERIQKYLNMLAGIKQDLQNFLDEQSAMGINPTANQLQQLFDISQEEIKSLLKQQGELKNLLDRYTFGSEKFNDVSQELQDIDNTISGLIQSQKEWNASILQIPVDQMSKLNDTLNLASSTLDDILSDYDSALSAVTGVIDKQTESLEDLKSTAEKSYQAQIDPLQEELDLLQKQNEEHQTQLDLEQRQYDLDRARNQKSTQVIRNGEMIYEADADAIRSASQGLADAQYNKLVKDLEDQISALESERDNLLEGYDSQIEKLNEIKEKWSSIVDDIQMAADLTKADSILGQGWQDQILSGNDDAIYQLFQGLYENTSSQKTQLEEQTASNERIAEMMNQFAAKYQEGSISYEQAMAGIQTLAQQMQDGYSSLEQLNTLLGLNGVDNLESLLQNMESSANASVSQFSDYMTIVKANADAMAQYTSSWSEMQQNIKDQIAALQKLAEETAKAAEATRQSYTGSRDDSSSKNNISNGTIYADGTTTITNEHVDGFYTGNTGPGGDRESDYINSGPGVKYHDGLKNGPVGSSTIPDKDTKLKLMGLKKLAPGEIASLLRKSEVVLTPEQQLNNLQNLATAWNFTPRIPDYSFTALLNQGSNTPVITVQMGDIKMDHVQDPDGFAKALFRDAEPVLRQQFSKIFRN